MSPAVTLTLQRGDKHGTVLHRGVTVDGVAGGPDRFFRGSTQSGAEQPVITGDLEALSPQKAI